MPSDSKNSLASTNAAVHGAALFKVEFQGLEVKDGYFASFGGFCSAERTGVVVFDDVTRR